MGLMHYITLPHIFSVAMSRGHSYARGQETHGHFLRAKSYALVGNAGVLGLLGLTITFLKTFEQWLRNPDIFSSDLAFGKLEKI